MLQAIRPSAPRIHPLHSRQNSTASISTRRTRLAHLPSCQWLIADKSRHCAVFHLFHRGAVLRSHSTNSSNKCCNVTRSSFARNVASGAGSAVFAESGTVESWEKGEWRETKQLQHYPHTVPQAGSGGSVHVVALPQI